MLRLVMLLLAMLLLLLVLFCSGRGCGSALSPSSWLTCSSMECSQGPARQTQHERKMNKISTCHFSLAHAKLKRAYGCMQELPNRLLTSTTARLLNCQTLVAVYCQMLIGNARYIRDTCSGHANPQHTPGDYDLLLMLQDVNFRPNSPCHDASVRCDLRGTSTECYQVHYVRL